MTVAERMIDTPRLRRARIGVSLLFLTNGAMWANVVPRLPEIKDKLDLNYTGFGVAVAFASIGSIGLGLISAPMLRRFGSARVAVIALALQSLAVWGAGVSPTVFLFSGFLFLNGALDANTDVAQNAQGMGIQRRLGRSIINSLHAMWSLGAAAGGLIGAGAVVLHLSIGVHLGLTSALFIAIAGIAYRLMLGPDSGIDRQDEPAHADAPERRMRVPRAALITVVMLGLVAIAGALVEDAGFTWSASYMKDDLHAAAGIAGFAFIGLMLLHFLGRIVGDKYVDRYGERAVARVGGVITAVGMGVALAWPTIPGTIVGFSLAGLGVATTVPAAFAASDGIPGLRPGTGITMVSWMLRISFLASPPIVGAVADATSLRTGLLVVPIAGIAVFLLAGALKGKAPHDDAPVAVITPAR